MNAYQEAYERMIQYFGVQGRWWPAESPFEVVVGAVLTQNTNWNNVEKALDLLRADNILNYTSMNDLSQEALAEYIRPAGFYNVKAKRLQNVFKMIEKDYNGNFMDLLGEETWTARDALIAVKGIGAETADAILLYAGDHAVFVVDAYTHRIFSRHNLLDEETDYQSIQETFLSNLDGDLELFRGYHGLIIEVAKKFCKKTKPRCTECPLRGLNDCEGGEVEIF